MCGPIGHLTVVTVAPFVYLCDCIPRTARIRQPNTVSQWLDQYHLSNYASLLMQNGYDHLHYLVGVEYRVCV